MEGTTERDTSGVRTVADVLKELDQLTSLEDGPVEHAIELIVLLVLTAPCLYGLITLWLSARAA